MSETPEIIEINTRTIETPDVATVPIDDTLSVQGEAADAKAVGDALALKADKSELAATITVNGQSADSSGAILVDAGDILISTEDETTVAEALAALEDQNFDDRYYTKDETDALLAEKVDTEDVTTALDVATAGTKVLDAAAGKVLNDLIAGKLDAGDVANNVTTTASGKALDARQGKTLQDEITALDAAKLNAAGALEAIGMGAIKSANIGTINSGSSMAVIGTRIFAAFAASSSNYVIVGAWGSTVVELARQGSAITVTMADNVLTIENGSSAGVRYIYFSNNVQAD